jgi:hypothetical protein
MDDASKFWIPKRISVRHMPFHWRKFKGQIIKGDYLGIVLEPMAASDIAALVRATFMGRD